MHYATKVIANLVKIGSLYFLVILSFNRLYIRKLINQPGADQNNFKQITHQQKERPCSKVQDRLI